MLESWVRALLVEPKAPWDKPALTTYKFQNHAVRTEGWRYIRYADGGEELYNESKDPYEWTNLANDTAMAAPLAPVAGGISLATKAAASGSAGRR